MKLRDLDHSAFVEMIVECMEEESMESLLQIPGVWEAVSEHFNNEAIQRWEAKQSDE